MKRISTNFTALSDSFRSSKNSEEKLIELEKIVAVLRAENARMRAEISRLERIASKGDGWVKTICTAGFGAAMGTWLSATGAFMADEYDLEGKIAFQIESLIENPIIESVPIDPPPIPPDRRNK